jgi:uncharacterized protein
MKLVLFLVLGLVIVWMLRASVRRRDAAPGSKPQTQPGPQAEDMVACAQCGMHLPRSEALPGRGGLFCGEAHRLVFEREQSRP